MSISFECHGYMREHRLIGGFQEVSNAEEGKARRQLLACLYMRTLDSILPPCTGFRSHLSDAGRSDNENPDIEV